MSNADDNSSLASEAATRLQPPAFDPSREFAVERMCVKIGVALRLARIYRMLTDVEAAERAGIPLRTYRRIERGDYRGGGLSEIGLMAWALDCELEIKIVPRDSDRSGEASETQGGSTEGESAGPQDIAQGDHP